MTALVFLVLLVGLGVVIWFAADGKLSDLGRVIFFCALLAICMAVAPGVRWFR